MLKAVGVKYEFNVAVGVALPYFFTVNPVRLGQVTFTVALKPAVQPIILNLKNPCGVVLPATG